MVTVLIHTLEEMGVPLIDHLSGLHLDDPKERMAQAKRVLSSLKPGISHFIIHPAKDTPELRHITDSWDCRSADYKAFINDDLRDFVVKEGIQVIGYKALKDLMPNLA